MCVDRFRHAVPESGSPFTAGVHAGLTGAFAIATLLDGSPVVYLDTLVEGEIGARMKDVHYAAAVWEAICARALPCDLSRDLILRVIHEHERRTKLAQEHP
ncbi:Scr1 family TA system antitoxin-like transcriptional regulator [Micromonospora sp. NPDC005707]|uniref:Scr1 family TA system antitoxin-like transcriptional regulator n=1 Tax=Micromonospora sp. NPDC005707 TaxID=3157050 RepID=UPI0033C56967